MFQMISFAIRFYLDGLRQLSGKLAILHASSIRFDEVATSLGPEGRILFEEKRNTCGRALIAYVASPLHPHRAITRPALSTHDHLVNSIEVETRHRSEHRLHRNKPRSCPTRAESIDAPPRGLMAAACAKPDILRPWTGPICCSVWALRENLIDVRRFHHGSEKPMEKFIRHRAMENVCHRATKEPLPLRRRKSGGLYSNRAKFPDTFQMGSDVHVLIRLRPWRWRPASPVRERLSVAMSAFWRAAGFAPAWINRDVPRESVIRDRGRFGAAVDNVYRVRCPRDDCFSHAEIISHSIAATQGRRDEAGINETEEK